MSEEVKITVNGESRSVPAPATLLSVLGGLGLGEKRGIAAAVNGSVIPRSAWNRSPLQANDQVIVIRATQGG